MAGKRNEIADITISACGIIHDLAKIRAGRKGDVGRGDAQCRQAAVQVQLDPFNGLIVDLLPFGIDQLDAVIGVRIVACRDHDPTVKFIPQYRVGNAWRCGDMEHIRIRARCGQACNDGILKHIARSPRVLADDRAHTVCAAPAVIPPQKAADLISVLGCERDTGLPSKTVRAEIFSHFGSFLRILFCISQMIKKQSWYSISQNAGKSQCLFSNKINPKLKNFGEKGCILSMLWVYDKKSRTGTKPMRLFL